MILLIGIVSVTTAPVPALADETPAGATPAPGLTAQEIQSLTQAARRGDEIAVRAIVIAAIARDSSNTSVIIRKAIVAAPTHADLIVESASRVFPNLAKRIAAAAQDISAKRSARARPPPEPAPDKPATPPAEPEKKWSGETSLGGSYRSGTVRAVNANANFKLAYETGPWKTESNVDFDFGRSDDVTNTHRLRIKGKIRRKIIERLYGFSLAEYDDDRFSGFDYQITEGIGLGYRLFDSPTFTLDVEGGPSLRQSRIGRTSELNHELLGRLATDISWEISDAAKFTNETTLLLAKNKIEVESATSAFIQDSTETRNISALDLKIIGNLAARLSYEVSFKPDPPPDGKATHMLGKVSLVHRF